MNNRNSMLAVSLLVGGLAACKGNGDKAPSAKQRSADMPMNTVAATDTTPAMESEESGGTGQAMALDEGKMGKKDSDRADGQYKMDKSPPASPKPVTKGAAAAPDDAVSEAAPRSWFPETFLFEPLIVTDDAGTATLPVRVPDRLTTWRVLALAHSRTGAQAGTVTSFLGTLPAYVDPIVPPFLIVGDEVRLPIQSINTTEAAISATLSVEAKGAAVSGASGPRTIAAQGSTVDYATLRVTRAGEITLRASLGGTDAVVRTFDALPSGRPERITRTGTLAAPRTFTIDGPPGSDPSTDRVRLLVYPGALALLRAELAASMSRGGVADDAYALLLAGKATTLLAALGDKPDPEALRTLALVAGQRAIRAGRTLTVTTASLLTEAALAHPDSPVLARLGARAAAYLAQQQRPDGTFAGETGWTLQRLLVATADGTRAVAAANTTQADRQRAMSVGVRAGGAFERNLAHVEDGYTAAAIIASGVGGKLAEKLRDKVRAAIKDAPDGTKYLDVPAGVVRADGAVPGRAEATALAVLALSGDPKAPVADLGATLLGAYEPMFGWGDGRANLACMQAVLELFKAPVPNNVTITLTMDGKPITSGTLEGAKIRDVLVLDAPAPGLSGSHTWVLTAEPAVPGLGFSLTAEAWTAWPTQPVKNGLELALAPTMTATVGKPADVTVAAIAPAGMSFHIQQALPAGVQVDTPSLQALVDAGTIQRFQSADGKLDLHIGPMQPGQTFSAKYRVIPTLGGTLHSSASIIESGASRFYVPPTTWSVK
jgi:hypothetical protein